MDVISAERATTVQAHAGNGGASDQQMVISFRLHERTYALPLTSVVQVVPMVQITQLPRVHPAVAGIINYRGSAVPIVNLRRYLQLPEQAPGLHTPILLITIEERIIGLIVDEVLDVMQFASDDVAQISDIMPEGLGEVPILRGLAHTEAGTMLMLDAEELFAADNGNGLGAALEQVEATAVAPEREEVAA